MTDKLLVTGASGRLGQAVIRHLLDTLSVDPARIVAASRTPEKQATMAEKGIETRRIDFDDPEATAGALTGIGRMLLISTDALGEPGKRLSQHKAAVAAAKQAGVGHVVYTSMPNPEDSLIPFAPDHLGTEQALAESGLGWTVLRNGWYMENLFMSLPGAVASGQWVSAAGGGKLAHIALDDCARAAATALADGVTANRLLTLTGSQARGTSEIAALVSTLTGQKIDVVSVSDDALRQGMIAHGVPEILAPIFASFDANTREGKIAMVTNDFETLTGAKPRALEDFLTAGKGALLARAA
ncbi:SDR family oxidoreductase [Pacificispira sp.]|uniref:SDR family oxidoreductase n=1 Tax=Pacificispira sp. TaxID=2888761 RepID=UPI003B517D59